MKEIITKGIAILMLMLSVFPTGSKDKTAIPKEETTEQTTQEQTTQEQTTRAECKEYEFICKVVMAECGHEPYNGIVAVAQCFKNAMKRDDLTAYETVKVYGYTSNRKTPNNAVKRAVAGVFCHGKGVTEEEILYFYNPSICSSSFHESQDFVIEIGNHRFFKRKGK